MTKKQILNTTQVAAYLGVARTNTIYRYMRHPKFPAVAEDIICKNKTWWWKHDIDKWVKKTNFPINGGRGDKKKWAMANGISAS